MSVRALCCIWGFLFSQSAYLSLLLPAHRWVLWKSPPDPLLDKIAAVITEDNPVWNGSATELVALLGEDIQPNILTRRLNVKAGDLRNEYSVEYTVKRTRNGSFISLARKTVWRLVTVVTIKMTPGSVSKIPSQSSQPSHHPNRSSRPHRKIRRFEDGWLRGFCDPLCRWAAAWSKYGCGKLMATPSCEDGGTPRQPSKAV